MDLIWLIILFSVISKIVKAEKKKQEAAQRARRAAEHGFGQGFEPGTAQKAAPKTKPAPVTATPTRTEVFQPAMQPLREVIKPTVHTHLAPDCEEHDRSGSMEVRSPEGKDDCHAYQLAPANRPRPDMQESYEESGIQLDWNGENMVKAFIMQEVLTRPCQRIQRR